MSPEDLAALHARTFDTTPPPWSARAFADLMISPNVFVLHVPEGFVLGRVAGPEAELLTLAVGPDARRQGHGADLILVFEAEARARGAEVAFLDVAETNAVAIRLYTRAGYVERARRTGYYARATPPVDGIVMSKAL